MEGFPDHNIDPRKKGEKEWILQAAQAIWGNSKTFSSGVFFHGRHKFQEYRDYANGRQSVNKYKSQLEPKDANGNTPAKFQQINYDIIPFIPKFRKIALGKINKIGYNIVGTAIDSLARDDEDDYFAEQKAKIKLLDELKDVPNAETLLDLGDDDPRTLEEVRIKQDYSYKHNAAIESEKGLKTVFTNNKYEQILNRVRTDLFDFGVGGVREYFDANGKIKIKHSRMKNFVSSYCEEEDFSDAYYLGEVEFLSPDQIAEYGEFDKTEMEEISNLKGNTRNWGRTRGINSIQTDDNKIAVLDFEIKSYNTKYYEKRENNSGNEEIIKTRFGRGGKNKEILKDGYEVIYKGKWIVETDLVFDYGLATNMKRKKNSLKETGFSWHLMAPNQDEMNFFGVVESMIPVADLIQIMWIKIQILVLKMKKPGVAFDLDALDNINLGHAGEVWKPRQAFELYEQTGDFPYRSQSKDDMDKQMNTQPITPISNPITAEIQNLANIMNMFLGLMRDNVGFNEITDGSTPDPRTLNGVANLAMQSTSNALAHIVTGSKHLNENLADSLVVRMQDAFSAGHKHYIKALGVNTQRFWKVEADITLHEIGIKFEDKPTDEEKAVLNKRIELAEQAGQITVADSCYIDTIDNVKEKAAVLAYLVKQNMEKKQAIDMQNIQANSQAQQESAMVASKTKQEEIKIEYAEKIKLANVQGDWKYRTEELIQSNRQQEANTREQGRVVTKQIENQGKERIKEMDN